MGLPILIFNAIQRLLLSPDPRHNFGA